MVPCSDAVAMYIPLEERTIAANGERWASICNSCLTMFMNTGKKYKQLSAHTSTIKKKISLSEDKINQLLICS